jgi:hypothetical protein
VVCTCLHFDVCGAPETAFTKATHCPGVLPGSPNTSPDLVAHVAKLAVYWTGGHCEQRRQGATGVTYKKEATIMMRYDPASQWDNTTAKVPHAYTSHLANHGYHRHHQHNGHDAHGMGGAHPVMAQAPTAFTQATQ